MRLLLNKLHSNIYYIVADGSTEIADNEESTSAPQDQQPQAPKLSKSHYL